MEKKEVSIFIKKRDNHYIIYPSLTDFWVVCGRDAEDAIARFESFSIYKVIKIKKLGDL